MKGEKKKCLSLVFRSQNDQKAVMNTCSYFVEIIFISFGEKVINGDIRFCPYGPDLSAGLFKDD